MYRVVKMASVYYTVKITDNMRFEYEDIQEFLDSGDVVVLGDDLETIAELLEIDEDDLIIVD